MIVFDDGAAPYCVIVDLDGTLYPRDTYISVMVDAVARLFVAVRGMSRVDALLQSEHLRRRLEEDWENASVTAFVLEHGFKRRQWHDFRAANVDIPSALRPDPDLARQLDRLRRRARIVLLTSNARGTTLQVLAKVGLDPSSFALVACGDDAGYPAKPDPAAFQSVLDGLGVRAQQCWSIGDRYALDIRPLRRLGGSGLQIDGPHELGPAVDHLLGKLGPTRGS